MNKYSCKIYLKYDEIDFQSYISSVLTVLGFEPKKIKGSIDMDTYIDDIPYDLETFISIMKREPNSITLQNMTYDEESQDLFKWFRVELSLRTDTVSLCWYNNDMEFLKTNDVFLKLLKNTSLICAYMYDVYDSQNQSNVDIERFKKSNGNEPFKTKVDSLGEKIVDISNHWGREVGAENLRFIAAPLMWFGHNFFEIISKEKLLSFQNFSELSEDLVHIKLFDLYENPALNLNRQKQKEFWSFFNLIEVIEKYIDSKSPDPNLNLSPADVLRQHLASLKGKTKK